MTDQLWEWFFGNYAKRDADAYVPAQWLYWYFMQKVAEVFGNRAVSYEDFLKTLYAYGFKKKQRGYPFKFTAIVGLDVSGFDALQYQVERAKEFIKYNEASELSIACSILSANPPVYLTDISDWLDGGTLSYTLTDSDGQEFLFCLDGRLDSKGKGKDVYWGVRYPTQEEGTLLEQGSLKAKALCTFLEGFYRLGEHEKFKVSNHHIVRTIEALRRIYG